MVIYMNILPFKHKKDKESKDVIKYYSLPKYQVGDKLKYLNHVYIIWSIGYLYNSYVYWLRDVNDEYIDVYCENLLDRFDKLESEDDNMSSNGELNKGINSELVQDYYRATTNSKGQVKFSPITMLNLCFVKHDGIDKVYVFENKSDKRLKGGERVRVMTSRGETDATVVSSIKLPKKYLKHFMKAFTGKYTDYLMPIIGVYTEEIKKITTLQKIGSKE